MALRDNCLFCNRCLDEYDFNCLICSMRNPTKAFYFGCYETTGHFLYNTDLHSCCSHNQFPWVDQIDSLLCPFGKHKHVEGSAKLHWLMGWTALAFWDNSVDSRDNSNSVFLCDGRHSFISMIVISSKIFPKIWDRFNFKIKVRENFRDDIDGKWKPPTKKEIYQ